MENPTLKGVVIEVDGQEVFVPFDRIAVYGRADECSMCGYHIFVSLGFKDKLDGFFLEDVTIKED